MTRPLITVAMATYNDFHGTYFSLQSARMYQDASDVEFLVLDNNPKGEHGIELKKTIANMQNTGMKYPVRYETYEENSGTSRTRERLFSLAQGEVVVVMDCHVLLQPGALQRLKAFWATLDEEGKKNFYTGPLISDNLGSVSTHFECEWNDAMWGVWASVWQDKDGNLVVTRQKDNKMEMRMLNDTRWSPTGIPWYQHEIPLTNNGFRKYGFRDTDEPFEIPAQGLGMFISAKEHFLGFNKDHLEFGGEECYIHEKYRMAGRKTICLPFMKWLHRFGRPEGIPYPLSLESRIRNYVLEFNELGLDLEPVRQHFVDVKKFPQQHFDLIVSDPVNYRPEMTQRPNTAPNNFRPEAVSNMGRFLPVVAENIHTMAMEVAAVDRDLNKHSEHLAVLASQCKSVLEFSKRRESTLFLLDGLCKKPCDEGMGCHKTENGSCQVCEAKIVSYQHERDTLIEDCRNAVKTTKGRLVEYVDNVWDGNTSPEIDENYDMLFLDANATYTRCKDDLAKFGKRINKYIAIHDVAVHGLKGEDGNSPGLLMAIRDFIKANPEWFVSHFTHEQYGLIVLSKDETKRPPEPIVPWPPMDEQGELCGVGAEVKKFLKSIGIEATPNCSCNKRAQIMNVKGPEWCRENIEQILDWLKEEADKRNMGMLFVRPAVKLTVKRCIRKAEKAIAEGKCV